MNTTNAMTTDIEGIRERAAAATPGHWGTHRDLGGTYTVQAQPRTTPTGTENEGDIAAFATDRTEAESYANSRFVAHARQDVPALLAVIDHLKEKHAEALALAMRRGEEISRLEGQLRATAS